MKVKKVCYTETAYIMGTFLLAFGIAMMERADFGMSVVVAPVYILYLKLSQYFPIFTFGMTEFLFQAILLFILFVVIGKFRKYYLFSFITVILYGGILDIALKLVNAIPVTGVIWRVIFYMSGILFCATGIAFFFHTYISPLVYELFVKEIAKKYGIKTTKVKTGFDCASCCIGICLSFIFFGFGNFEGINWGTVLCALINGKLINIISEQLENLFIFVDALL